jgi:hypothetical protein
MFTMTIIVLLSVLDYGFCNFCPTFSPKDASVRVCEEHAHRTQGNQSICPSQTSGNTLNYVLVFGPIRMKLLSQILICA